MSALRTQMTHDMIVRGLTPGTQKSYLRAVTDLAQFAHRRPDQLGPRRAALYGPFTGGATSRLEHLQYHCARVTVLLSRHTRPSQDDLSYSLCATTVQAARDSQPGRGRAALGGRLSLGHRTSCRRPTVQASASVRCSASNSPTSTASACVSALSKANAAKIGMSRSPPAYSPTSALIGGVYRPMVWLFPNHTGTQPSSPVTAHAFSTRRKRAGWPNPGASKACGTPLPPICWKQARTSIPSNGC